VVQLEDAEHPASPGDRHVGLDDVGRNDLVLEGPRVARDDLRADRAPGFDVLEVGLVVGSPDLGRLGRVEDLSLGNALIATSDTDTVGQMDLTVRIGIYLLRWSRRGWEWARV
jgi:hypothetical protein